MNLFTMLIDKIRGRKPVVGLFAGKTTLDIGCGDGGFLSEDKENFIGIDINPETLKKAKDAGFAVAEADATKLPFKDAVFEGVFCRYLIEHLTPQQAYEMLSEICRVLAPGGRLVLETETATKQFWETFSHVRPYPPKAIEKMLREDGLENFPKFRDLEVEAVYYLGIRQKGPLGVISLLAANLGVFQRSYVMMLRKKR